MGRLWIQTRRGIKNAAVLPDPVSATPIISLIKPNQSKPDKNKSNQDYEILIVKLKIVEKFKDWSY